MALACSDAYTHALKVLVVEDHPVYLEGLYYVLESLADEVLIESVQGLEAAKAMLSKTTEFDLILLDLSLGDGPGLSLLRYLQIHRILIPVAILSASEESQDVGAAIAAGASGFISKASGRREIARSIAAVLEGETPLPEFYKQDNTPSPDAPVLTPRQYEVLQLLAEGLPNKRICQQLELTEHTVKSHIKTLFSIFEVHNRTECAHAAAECGLLEH